MSDVVIQQEERQSPRAQYGIRQKFLPLPIMPHHAQFFAAGPLTFGVEARVIQEGDGPVSQRSASIHIFNTERTEEYLRFDCFADFPHYHYILNKPQHNIAWGYDADTNGPMLPWALRAIRERLPQMLRRADESELAEAVERQGIDPAVFEQIEHAIQAWEPQSAELLIKETRDWYNRWKKLHPQFNTDA